MELTEGLLMLYFSPVAQITVLNVDADVKGHLWPPIIAGYQLKGLKAACMSSDACIVVLFDGTGPRDATAPSAITWMAIFGRLGTRRLGTAFLCILL
jgi:hypothetical protein